MALTIPKRHKPVVAELVRLSKTERKRLLQTLQGLSISTLKIKPLAKRVADETSLSPKAAEDIIAVLVTLYTLPYVTSTRRDQVIPDLIKAILTDADLGASEEDAPDLEQFFGDALAPSSPVSLLAKSVHLLRGSERSFCTAIIFTDLRPVFGDEIEDPQAVIGNHLLRLTYHESGLATKDFFVNLGSDDLDELAKLIERARKKEGKLRDLSIRTGVTYLSTEEERC